MPEAPNLRPAARVLGLALGYVAACVVASFALTIMFFIAQIGQTEALGPNLPEAASRFLGMTGISMLFIFFLALPGFVLLRVVLWAMGRRELVSFMAIGAMNGALVVWFVTQNLGELSNSEPGIGAGILLPAALGGAATWWVERWFAKRNPIKALML